MNERAIFAADVRAGLGRRGQKELPSKYLYDDVGSALFDVICLLPEYGLTRAGIRLLGRHAEEIVSRARAGTGVDAPVVVAELGSGSGQKTRYLLDALARLQTVTYCPIDISGSALRRCAQELGGLHAVSIVGYETPYLDGLRRIAERRRSGERLLVLFLGSTIGNFDRPAAASFLREVRRQLIAGDAMLLAADLLKPEAQLLAAYDDALGVTAAFNLNLLARINRDLGSGFDLAAFRHAARFIPEDRRIEMHLVARRPHAVRIPGAEIEVAFAEGESIWTESCHKFTVEEIEGLGAASGFLAEARWIDQEWPFLQCLLRAV